MPHLIVCKVGLVHALYTYCRRCVGIRVAKVMSFVAPRRSRAVHAEQVTQILACAA
jgi:hypothetical protein